MADNTLELAEVIKALRQELIAAQQEGNDKGIQFLVNNVEIELETVVGKEEVAGGGVKTKFFVLDINADANVKFSHASKQKIKLSLGAVEVKGNPDGTKTTNAAKIKGKA